MAKASKPITLTLREWQAILECYLERMRQPGKSARDIAKIDKWFEEGTDCALRMPFRTVDDLLVLAAVACHWNSDPDAGLSYPQCVGPADGFDRRSLARLVQAILDLAKVRLDSDGRLQTFAQARK